MEENISDLLENPEDPVPEKCKEKKKQRRSKKSVVVEEENIVEENIMEDDIPDLLENNPEHPVPEKCQEKKKRGRSKKSIVVEDLNIVEENIMEDDISDSLANNLGDSVTEKGQGKKKQGRSKKSVVVENENVVKENIMEDDIPDLLGNNPGDPVPEKDQGKKKRGRSTKKSVVVEDEKRVKFLSKLLNCDGMPSHTVEVLKLEEQEKGHLYKLNSLEMEKLWNDLRDPVKTRLNNLMCPEVEQFKEESREVLSAIISLLLHTTALHDVADSEALAWIAVAFNLVLIEKNTGQQLKSKISELCEYCCIKGIRVDGSFYLNTINFLLDLTVDDKNGVDRKPEIKRMWEMRVALARLNLRTQSCESVVARLEKIVASPTYLACKEGRQFIAFTLTLDIKLIKRLHKAIKDFLSICKRTQACAYGEVYYSAWFNGSSEVRQELEKHCIQNLMTHMFVFKRHKQELVHTGQNVFAILSYLHHHRTTAQFSKVLTELYMPLLWRHLRSGNNIERSNAALVFLDVYPLEMPGSGRADESDFCIKQHNEMVDLLTDTCHVVRMIAIRGICSKLCSAWRTFPQETIQVLMRNLIELSNDASDYKVRVTLYDSLRDLLLNPESAAYLMRILPKLRDNIHDENEKVRKSFVKLLLSVKTQTSETRVPYWKIVPIDHLAARLQLEKAEVGSLLCKLLMSNIYSPDHSADVFLFRIIRFIDTNPAAARNLFQFSMKVLEYKDAVRIMLTILLNLRAYVKKKLEESNVSNVPEEQENKSSGSSSGGRRRKKRKSLEHLQTICENEQDELEETDKENSSQLSNTNSSADSSKEEDEFGRPGVFHALVDIVSLLWSMHSNKLADPERHKDHEDLMDCAVAGIPLFLRYYKVLQGEFGCPGVFHALVDIVSLLWSMHSNKLADPERHKDHEDLMDCAVAGIPLFLSNKLADPERHKDHEDLMDCAVAGIPLFLRYYKLLQGEFGRPGVFHALVDIVSLLWSMHSNKLADPERHKDHEDLMDCAVAGIPLFLRYYKVSLVVLECSTHWLTLSVCCGPCTATSWQTLRDTRTMRT
ncbi:condensin-2 complex subunit G2-like [Macrosteles quadrilineatus]|uniref:condensin-2 complex subunit G2-like n=1 Tax=Macrosteles quadrilineatus TaxID=74068 RepID=UPI0023E284E1|nr:condensin-2 complex subunit G2-like [Macrosteles quadrilineatus]